MHEMHLVQVIHVQMIDQKQKGKYSQGVPPQRLKLHYQLVQGAVCDPTMHYCLHLDM
jgi:hypothetical protein